MGLHLINVFILTIIVFKHFLVSFWLWCQKVRQYWIFGTALVTRSNWHMTTKGSWHTLRSIWKLWLCLCLRSAKQPSRRMLKVQWSSCSPSWATSNCMSGVIFCLYLWFSHGLSVLSIQLALFVKILSIGCISEHCTFFLVAIFDARLKVPKDACSPNSCLLCWYLYVLCAVLLVRTWKMILQLSLLITKNVKQIPHSFTLLMLWRKSRVDVLAFTQFEKLQQLVGF